MARRLSRATINRINKAMDAKFEGAIFKDSEHYVGGQYDGYIILCQQVTFKNGEKDCTLSITPAEVYGKDEMFKDFHSIDRFHTKNVKEANAKFIEWSNKYGL